MTKRNFLLYVILCLSIFGALLYRLTYISYSTSHQSPPASGIYFALAISLLVFVPIISLLRRFRFYRFLIALSLLLLVIFFSIYFIFISPRPPPPTPRSYATPGLLLFLPLAFICYRIRHKLGSRRLHPIKVSLPICFISCLLSGYRYKNTTRAVGDTCSFLRLLMQKINYCATVTS